GEHRRALFYLTLVFQDHDWSLAVIATLIWPRVDSTRSIEHPVQIQHATAFEPLHRVYHSPSLGWICARKRRDG
ncbi:MAG: hypothetical protein ACJ8MR_11250, partial [Povalibacter sp.]